MKLIKKQKKKLKKKVVPKNKQKGRGNKYA
jgi:hypothetical protein